ncbi:MAG: iron-containing alcohol dehydrogenase [Kiritimatiellaeota bacterium]|nr:iron-containing alcohol dehydrogenase [Kiritimatiellota bacterium]
MFDVRFLSENIDKGNFTEMSTSYSLRYPEEIKFGSGASANIAEVLPPEGPVLLVTGRSALSNGLAERFKKLLASHEIIDATGMSSPEPTLECVDAIIETGRAGNAKIVVAVGGGSCIDATKAAAAIIPESPAKTADFFNGERSVVKRGLFLAALPTTAGTGAEITSNAVLTESALKIKKSIRSPFMVPDTAIIDPELTISSPPGVTAASGMDAFTQALESFTSSNANSVTRPLAETSMVKIFANIAAATADGSDLNARTEMAEGSMLSAMSFSQSGLGAVHGLAHPIGSLLKLPHGKVCAILLPVVMKWNKTVCELEYARIADACGVSKGADGMIEAIRNLNAELGVPDELRSSGLDDKHFDFIIKNCRSRSMSGNPRPMSDDDVEELIASLIRPLV